MARTKIEKVFVDREAAIKYLDDELKSRMGGIVERAIRITQAPGTGKTRFLQEFIKRMEGEKKGVGLYINSPEIERWIMRALRSFRRCCVV